MSCRFVIIKNFGVLVRFYVQGLLNPKAMARLSLGEALTNLVWAKVHLVNIGSVLSDYLGQGKFGEYLGQT